MSTTEGQTKMYSEDDMKFIYTPHHDLVCNAHPNTKIGGDACSCVGRRKELLAKEGQSETQEEFGIKLLRWFETEKDSLRVNPRIGYDEIVKQFLTRKKP